MLLSLNAWAGEPDANIYVERFIGEMEAHGVKIAHVHVTVQFGFNLTDYHTLGQCNLKTHLITLSESYWMTASDTEREALMFHELGHCVLGRRHDDGGMPVSGGAIYKSIMNTYGNLILSQPCHMPTLQEEVRESPNALWCYNDIQRDIYAPESPDNYYNKYRSVYLSELFSQTHL